ncbi:hypothetical protein KXW10_007516, partial [Aspergillus fumigatus]
AEHPRNGGGRLMETLVVLCIHIHIGLTEVVAECNRIIVRDMEESQRYLAASYRGAVWLYHCFPEIHRPEHISDGELMRRFILDRGEDGSVIVIDSTNTELAGRDR